MWQVTGRAEHLDPQFFEAARLIVETIRLEQDHGRSAYSFERFDCVPSDTLTNEGRGSPVGPTGMSWSGFRPSDDACQYHYLVPANMMAVSALERLAGLPGAGGELAKEAFELAGKIRAGIEAFGKIVHPQFGEIYAYEVDGLGNFNLMDDANAPSLLAMPLIGYCGKDDPAYLRTREFVLSRENPYYYQGEAAKGVGSPHTPDGYIWPIALCIEGLTANSRQEKLAILETLMLTDGGTGLMHESFDKDAPERFTRPWFAWANSMFAELVIDIIGQDELA